MRCGLLQRDQIAAVEIAGRKSLQAHADVLQGKQVDIFHVS
jgi:hypothetical protein